MSVHSFTVKDTTGKDQPLGQYEGKVLLIVNTATKCGFTPQFKELEQLYQMHKDDGFVVLGFPCNQFMNQEPLSNEEMVDVCERNFGVTFPLFAKIHVNGKEAHPLYQYLKKEQKGMLNAEIKWNFTKFLIDKNGQVIERYSPATNPLKIEDDMKRLLVK